MMHKGNGIVLTKESGLHLNLLEHDGTCSFLTQWLASQIEKKERDQSLQG